MRYTVLDTMEIDYSFLDNLSLDNKKLVGMIFDIAKSHYLIIQKIRIKENNVTIYIIRDNKANYLVQDLRSNCIKFSNSRNIDRYIDINDFLEGTLSF